LDGVWKVERSGGILPPLIGVRKVISGARGETKVGSLPGVPFDVRGYSLHYRGLLAGFIDELEPHNGGFRGWATYRGRPFGTFTLRRR
jgi:hypothetical protein